jgi:hypothetical protein
MQRLNYSRISTTSKPVSFNVPRFYQTSFLAFRPLKGKEFACFPPMCWQALFSLFLGANLVTEINLEFRPEQPSGILLLSGERDDLTGDFMIVTLNNGYVEFVFDCGSGKGVIRSSEKVVLHQWNTLMIYRYRWEGWIELNEVRLSWQPQTLIISTLYTETTSPR